MADSANETARAVAGVIPRAPARLLRAAELGLPMVWDFTCLVIDRDAKFAAQLAHLLAACGIKPHVIGALAAVHVALRQWAFDGVVLDAQSVGENYVPALRFLAGRTRAPIVLLTSMTDVQAHILDLDSGAADVLVKPVSAHWVASKMRRWLSLQHAKEEAPRGGPVRCAGNVTVDRDSGELRTDTAAVTLSTAEVAMMLLFAARIGQVVPRSALAEACRRQVVERDRAIDMSVVRLRRKLAAVSARGVAIDSVRGRGYRMTERALPALANSGPMSGLEDRSHGEARWPQSPPPLQSVPGVAR